MKYINLIIIVLSMSFNGLALDNLNEPKPGFWSRSYTKKYDKVQRKVVKQNYKFQNGSDHITGLYSKFSLASSEELPGLVEEALMLLLYSAPGSSRSDQKKEFTELSDFDPNSIKVGENAYGFRKYDPAKDAEVRQYQVMMAGFCGAYLGNLYDYEEASQYLEQLKIANVVLDPDKDNLAYKKHLAYMLRFIAHGTK